MVIVFVKSIKFVLCGMKILSTSHFSKSEKCKIKNGKINSWHVLFLVADVSCHLFFFFFFTVPVGNRVRSTVRGRKWRKFPSSYQQCQPTLIYLTTSFPENKKVKKKNKGFSHYFPLPKKKKNLLLYPPLVLYSKYVFPRSVIRLKTASHLLLYSKKVPPVLTCIWAEKVIHLDSGPCTAIQRVCYFVITII